ncbi:hypothetical protein BRCON_2421 [Candidatus Sumerlaea chitinivorans]|uniref:Uncharacterized protein n=1 Tax=Sumerlaea chitinivorans TaxID=2250252 RepID=A0A2Z4Y7J2_SUMC1|nr:hypothetical protein BRCON_2421 [Candidatus Sumerlaea chitinivorans]
MGRKAQRDQSPYPNVAQPLFDPTPLESCGWGARLANPLQ